MFAGIILTQSEVRWGTVLDGRYVSFRSALDPGGLSVLLKPEACRAFISRLSGEIARVTGQDLRCAAVCAPAPLVPEYAVLKDALAGAEVRDAQVLNLAAAAAAGRCREVPEEDATLLIAAADGERYDLCVANNGSGVCEIVGSAALRRKGLSDGELLRAVFALLDRIAGPNQPMPERILTSRSLPDDLAARLRERLGLPAERFDPALSLYGATIHAGAFGKKVGDFLLLAGFDYRIAAGAETLIEAGATIPTLRQARVPAAAVRDGSVRVSLQADGGGAQSLLLPLPRELAGRDPLTIAAAIDARGNLSFRLAREGGPETEYGWPEVRNRILRTVPEPPVSGERTPAETAGPAEDDGPFVFVSYAHKDKDRILPIIGRLQRAGYRVWYDSGIHPGSEWPEIIAGHVEKCAVFLPFLTREYMASENCKRELHYAGDLNKTRTLIFLEKVALTGGMKLQHGLQQAVEAYALPDAEALFRRLCQAEGMAAAKK